MSKEFFLFFLRHKNKTPHQSVHSCAIITSDMGCCGPKMAIVGIFLSIWAILQLSLMGILFFCRAVLLLPDVIEETKIYENADKFYKEADDLYRKTAFRCWQVTGFYVVLLLFSLYKHRSNKAESAKKAQQKAAPNQKSMMGVSSTIWERTKCDEEHRLLIDKSEWKYKQILYEPTHYHKVLILNFVSGIFVAL